MIKLRTTSSQVQMSAPCNMIVSVSDHSYYLLWSWTILYSFIYCLFRLWASAQSLSHVFTSLSMYLRRFMYTLAPQCLIQCARQVAYSLSLSIKCFMLCARLPNQLQLQHSDFYQIQFACNLESRFLWEVNHYLLSHILKFFLSLKLNLNFLHVTRP